ncbi:MAG: lipocalin-like domain-containing protein [Pseudomonadota bacterium]
MFASRTLLAILLLTGLVVGRAAPLAAQGFAGLGTTAEGFGLPIRGTELRFPEDHGPHPDFRIEWWYLTANLTGADGQDYGVQWTLFRSALLPEHGGQMTTGWQSPQIWMGHAALTGRDWHLYEERFSRGGIGTAGATAAPFSAWIDDWQMTSTAKTGVDALSALTLQARGADFAYDLALAADRPLVLHGDAGFSVKSQDGRASYYYAQPHYQVRGEIETKAGPVAVTGIAWLDREWSSQPLGDTQEGWDWTALTLDSGDKVLVAQLRDGGDGFRFGTWIGVDGQTEPLDDTAIRLTPRRTQRLGATAVPTRWRVEVPAKGVDIEIEALNPAAWMGTSTAYWEGPVFATGSHTGRGYLEMTGYDTGPALAGN